MIDCGEAEQYTHKCPSCGTEFPACKTHPPIRCPKGCDLTVATFSDELATFARLLSDRLRSRAFDIHSEEGDCPQSNALELVADEIDEVLHEGPNPPEPKPRVECPACHTIGLLGDGGKCPRCKGKGYL